MISLAQAERLVAGTYIDWDGVAGNQCWDWAQWYYHNCVRPGGILWTTPGAQNPGYASGTWEGFAVNGLGADFVQIGPDQPAQHGDIVICAYGSATYPVSHVFVALADAGANIYGLSQNSAPPRPDLPGYSPESTGPVVRQYLPKDRIAGYLRPRNNITTHTAGFTPIVSSASTPPQEDELSQAEVSQIVQAVQGIVQTERATTVAEVRANAVAVSNTVKSEAYDGKVFNQKVMNQNGDRIIHDDRAQIAGLTEVVKQLAQIGGTSIDLDKVFEAAKRGAEQAIAEGIVQVEISIAKPELETVEVDK